MICFAIIAHEGTDVLQNQIENVRAYNPGCKVVLYNISTDTQFGKSAEVPVCPYSRPMEYGKRGKFYMDVMRWLEETDMEYDYLVNLDSDTMFIRPGFERYLRFIMRGYDYMGIAMETITSPDQYPEWDTGKMMWREWGRWKPFFNSDSFCVSYHTNQVFKKPLVRRMVRSLNWGILEWLIETTEVYGLEKVLWPTLAKSSGGKLRPYLWESVEGMSGTPLGLEQLQEAASRPHVYFVQPIKKDMKDPARKRLSELNNAEMLRVSSDAARRI